MLIISWGRCGIEIEDADNELWLATNPQLHSTSGKYFVEKVDSKARPQAYNQEFRNQLFGILEKQTGLIFN